MGDIFQRLLPLLRPRARYVINVPDMWWENERVTIHVSLIEELRRRDYGLRNIIIWECTNIVNRIGIFGWPSNYITMGVTFEYLLDFWRPPAETSKHAVSDPEFKALYEMSGCLSCAPAGLSDSYSSSRRLMKNPRWGWNDLQGSGLAAT